MTAQRKKTNYVDNEKFLVAISSYRDSYMKAKNDGSELPKIPDYVGKCIMDIANNLAKAPNFSGYSYKDEMISDGIENALTYCYSFDPEKGKNPFAYFTQIIWFAFLRRIEKEKKQQYIKHKVMQNSAITNGLAELSVEDRAHFNSILPELDIEKLNSLEDKFGPKKDKKNEH